MSYTTRASWGKPLPLAIFTRPKMEGYGVAVSGKDIRNLQNYTFPLPDGKNWNDRISSIVVADGWEVKLYARKNFKGHHTKWLDGRVPRLAKVPDPGDNWNNAATSIKIRRK